MAVLGIKKWYPRMFLSQRWEPLPHPVRPAQCSSLTPPLRAECWNQVGYEEGRGSPRPTYSLAGSRPERKTRGWPCGALSAGTGVLRSELTSEEVMGP